MTRQKRVTKVYWHSQLGWFKGNTQKTLNEEIIQFTEPKFLCITLGLKRIVNIFHTLWGLHFSYAVKVLVSAQVWESLTPKIYNQIAEIIAQKAHPENDLLPTFMKCFIIEYKNRKE